MKIKIIVPCCNDGGIELTGEGQLSLCKEGGKTIIVAGYDYFKEGRCKRCGRQASVKQGILVLSLGGESQRNDKIETNA